jgi:hypothetical protein
LGAQLFAWDDSVEAAHLLAIYRRRLEHLGETGARTVGSGDFLRDLEQTAEEGRRLSPRVVRDAELHYVIMLDPASDAQACLGTDPALGNPEFDWDDPAL